ncbi:DUF4177 domain-containing protein [Clostridium mediterraneense]|nr:DUF4177 domain-containing protein [Clostridium mediterraneense]
MKKESYFDKYKEIINEQAKGGWRLKQVVILANEKNRYVSILCLSNYF